MTGLGAWIRSARFPSQLTVLLPLVVGQLLAEDLDSAIFVWVLVFGLFDQLYIVWANDYADRFDDPFNEHPTPFAGGSRVLVEGLLSPRALGTAAIVAASGAFAVSGYLVASGGSVSLLALCGAAIALLWAYSFGPLRLSYRGGGELLQMLGVGAVLPVFGYVAQAGSLAGFPWAVLAGLLPLELGCAIATSRPDEAADRRVRKHTLSVVLGGTGAGLLMVGLHALALALLQATLPAEATAGWALPAALGFNALALLTVRARPGTRLMVFHVACAVSVTVTALGLLAYQLWPA